MTTELSGNWKLLLANSLVREKWFISPQYVDANALMIISLLEGKSNFLLSGENRPAYEMCAGNETTETVTGTEIKPEETDTTETILEMETKSEEQASPVTETPKIPIILLIRENNSAELCGLSIGQWDKHFPDYPTLVVGKYKELPAIDYCVKALTNKLLKKPWKM